MLVYVDGGMCFIWVRGLWVVGGGGMWVLVYVDGGGGMCLHLGMGHLGCGYV